MSLTTNDDGSEGSFSIAYDGTTALAGAEQFTLDHSSSVTFTAAGETLVLGGFVSHAGQYYRLRTDQAISRDLDGNVISGQFSLIDKDGDRVQVDDGTSYTFFTAGSSLPSAGPVPAMPLGD